MEEKYEKLNEKFKGKIKHLILSDEKQQNRKFITDFRGIQQILSKSTDDCKVEKEL